MSRLISFFDYIFFRVYSFFFKRRDDIAEVKATNLIAILQSFLILDLFAVIRKVFPFELPKEYFNKWIWGLPLVLIIGFLNHYRYRIKLKKTGYSDFEEKWGKEIKITKLIKGWLIVFLIFFLIFGVVILMIAL